MARFFWICLGGAVGTGARYLVTGWILRVAGPGFPFATLAINAIGSLFLSLLIQVVLATESFSPTFRLTLTAGVLGGFTTYSTFNSETLQLFQEGAWWLGFANLGLTVTTCLAAGLLGTLAGRLLVLLCGL